MRKCYPAQIQLLATVAAEAAGVPEVDPVAILASLVRHLPPPRKRAPGVPRYQGLLPISPARVRELLENAANRRLANRIARLSLRVLGPDAPLRQSYPLYCAFACSLGLSPWSRPYYSRHAFGFRPKSLHENYVLL